MGRLAAAFLLARSTWASLMCSLTESRLTLSTLLSPLPTTITSPSILNAFFSTLTTPSTATSTLSPSSSALSPTFPSLSNPLSTSLPAYLTDTLDALTLHAHESNNVGYLNRQIGRERSKHESAIKDREEENIRRRRAGLPELPGLPAEPRNATKEPNRLELLLLQGQVDGLAKAMGSEAAKGLVRAYI